MKFEKIEAYREQRDKITEALTAFQRKEAGALEKVQALKAEYEATIRRSISDGADVSAELDRLDDEIRSAQAEYERRKKERLIFGSLPNKESITKDDVLEAWNGEFIPEYRETKLNPVLENLLRAKAEYVKAAKVYRDCVDEVADMRSDVLTDLGDHYYYKLRGVKFNYSDEKKKYLLTPEIAEEVYNQHFGHSEIEKLLSYGEGDE